MIAYINGRLLEKQPPVLVLDVNGLGYELEAPMTTFYDLPEVGCGHRSARSYGGAGGRPEALRIYP